MHDLLLFSHDIMIIYSDIIVMLSNTKNGGCLSSAPGMIIKKLHAKTNLVVTLNWNVSRQKQDKMQM